MYIGTPPRGLTRRPAAGFTLVEMAVVVTLIGILMALGLATATSVMESSQRATNRSRTGSVSGQCRARSAAVAGAGHVDC